MTTVFEVLQEPRPETPGSGRSVSWVRGLRLQAFRFTYTVVQVSA